MSRTAVVILNFNGEKLLPQFLPSVVERSGSAQVIVADNGSTDQSLKLLDEQFPSVTVIRLDKNYGFCGGYNRALNQVKSDYVVLLNSDVEVTPGWLKPMTDLLDSNPSIGALQPKILSYRERHLFEYAGAAGGFIDSLGYPFCRGRIFDTVETDRGQYDDSREIFWATGACLMIRLDLYHQLGGLDEDFFAHMEEIDLCWKIQRRGMKVFSCGKSSVYHLGAGTLGYGSPGKVFLNFRNGLNLIFKHLDTREMIYKLPVRMLLDWVAALKFVVSGEFNQALAVLRAHFHFLKGLPRTMQKRQLIRAANPEYPRTAVYGGSVLFGYFLKGWKTFSGNYQ